MPTRSCVTIGIILVNTLGLITEIVFALEGNHNVGSLHRHEPHILLHPHGSDSNVQGREGDQDWGGVDTIKLGDGKFASKLFHASQTIVSESLHEHVAASNEFDSVNRKLQDYDDLFTSVLVLPDISFPVGGIGIFETTVYAKNITCTDVSLQNITIGHERKSNSELALQIAIDGFAFDCGCNWEYDSIIDGSGAASLNSTDSKFLFEITFFSNDFDTSPPTSANATTCDSDVQLSQVNAEGGVDGIIIGIIASALRTNIEGAMNPLFCEELDNLVAGMNDLMKDLNEILEPLDVEISEELEDPMFPENNIVVPDGLELFNFNDGDGLFGMIFDTITTMLGENENGSDLAINDFLRSTILNEDGVLVIDSQWLTQNGDLYSAGESESGLSIRSIKIFGIDTLTEFKPLDILGDYTLSTNFAWDTLSFEVDVEVNMSPFDSEADLLALDAVQAAKLTFGIEGLDMDFAVMAAIKNKNITDIPFGSMTAFDKMAACMLENAFHDMEIADMSLTVNNIVEPTIEITTNASNFGDLVTSFGHAVFAMYEGTVLNLMPSIFQVTLRTAFNDAIDTILTEKSKCLFESNTEPINLPDLLMLPDEAMDFGGTGLSPYGTIFPTIFNTLIDYLTGFTDGEADINDFYLSPITFEQSGVNGTWMLGELINVDSNFTLGSLIADIKLNIYNVTVENLDNIGSPFHLLSPTDAKDLSNAVTFGIGIKPFTFRAVILLKIDDGDGFLFDNHFEFAIKFNDMAVDLDLFMTMVEDRLMNMPLRDMMNLDCVMSMVQAPNDDPTMYIDTLSLLASKVDIDASCFSCQTPNLELLVALIGAASLFFDLTGEINGLMESLTKGISGEQGSFQSEIDKYISNAPIQCPSSPDYRSSDTNNISTVNRSSPSLVPELDNFFRNFAIFLGTLFIGCIIAVGYIRREKKQSLASLREGSSGSEDIKMKQMAESQRENELNSETTSLFTSKAIPVFIRFLIPIVILGNIALFLSGHLSLGVTVDADINILGDQLEVEVFTFTLLSSMRSMWNNDAEALAIFLGLFSGIWPYTKQLITMFLWFSPPSRVSVSKRGSILKWLDTLGKWSFVDIFVSIMTVVGFRIIVQSPTGGMFDMIQEIPGFIGDGLYSINLLVTPHGGLYSNMIAQIISQISSHFIIHFHRKVLLEASTKPLQEFNEKEALCRHSFKVEGRGQAKVLRGTNIGIFSVALFTMTFYVCASVSSNFSIESFGLLGVLVEAGENTSEAIISYTTMSLVDQLVGQAKMTNVQKDYIGFMALSIVLIFTVLVVPLLLVMLLLFRWYVPLNKKYQWRMFIAIEVLSAWQYSEVYILSVVIAALQLGSLSLNLVNDFCGGLDGFFDTLVSLGIVSGIDGQCFRAEATAGIGLWLLSCGAVLLALLKHFINNAATQQQEETNVEDVANYDDLPQSVASEFGDQYKSPPTFSDYYRCLLSRSHGGEEDKTPDSPTDKGEISTGRQTDSGEIPNSSS